MEKIKSQEELEKHVIFQSNKKPVISLSNKEIEFEVILKDISNLFANISIDNCVFKKGVSFKEVTIEGGFNMNSSKFYGSVDFTEFTVSYKSRIQSSYFCESVIFNNSRFDELADFWNSTFSKPTIFYKVDFRKVVVFSYAKFTENVLFTYTLFDGVVIFKNTKFCKGLDLSLAIITGKLRVYNIDTFNYDLGKNVFENENFEDKVSNKGEIPSKNIRETFRILKNEAVGQNDFIASSNFSREEKYIYFREVWSDKLSWRTMQERFVLSLNYISTNFGTYWLNGVLFTFVCGLIIFYLMILSTDKYIFGYSDESCSIFASQMHYFFEFILPTHKIDFLQEFKPSLLTYILDLFGRIFISFGVYQTIQAFRKNK